MEFRVTGAKGFVKKVSLVLLAFILVFSISLGIFRGQDDFQPAKGQQDGFFAEVGSIKVFYISKGEGQPLLLLHGLGGSTLAWEKNIDFLAQYFRVIALDLPGHGYSDKPDINYTLSWGGVDFLDKFLESLGLQKVSLVGQSAGGLLALALSLKFPDKVEKLVLVGNAGLGKEAAFSLRLMSLPLVGEIIGRPNRWVLERLVKKELFYDPKLVPEDLVERMYQIRKQPGAKRAMLKWLRQGVNITGIKKEVILVDRLAELRTPVLVIWGENDKILPAPCIKEVLSRISDGKFIVFPKTGHWPQMEKSAEFDKAVLEFLRD